MPPNPTENTERNSPMCENPNPWVSYAESPPKTAGVYEWRVPSTVIPGLLVIYAAHLRTRSLCSRDVLSPVFDYWEGSHLIVPPDTHWRLTNLHEDIKGQVYSTKILSLDGVDNVSCPFCGEVPKWAAVRQSRDGGIFVGSYPHQYNSWWLKCCRWGRTPHYDDPRELALVRNKALSGRTQPSAP